MQNIAESQPVILIVEDTIDFAEMTMHILRRMGIEASHTVSAADAIEFIDSQCPDLVLLDLNLPGESGWEVLKHLNESNIERHVPVIVTSAYSDSANRLVGKLQNVYKYMIKPFPPQDLMQAVRQALRLEEA
ncbi:MAG: response regulator [Anaerolineae bacterium]|nr:response regulator [Anaerolineae bacterium]